MGNETFDLIYVDPPWRYSFSKSNSRKIENQYPTMALEEICSLPIPANPNSVLLLWGTAPKVPEALKVMSAWGFEYKTCAIWDKQMIGMGYYFRGQHELLFVGTKGKPVIPAPSSRKSSVLSFKRGRHSAKPVEMYDIIDGMYPDYQKLEMFARNPEPRINWSFWGNEA